MAISTQTWAEASRLINDNVLVDEVTLYSVGDPVTSGFTTTRALTEIQKGLPAIVQTTVLENAVESLVSSTYSIKVSRGTAVAAGMAVKVTSCAAEPSLVGKTLLINKVSENGLAVLRKATATDFLPVNQEGKGDL